MKRRTFNKLGLATALSALPVGSTSSFPASSRLKVGLLTPLSGPLQERGEECVKGARLAQIMGLDRDVIELVVADTRSSLEGTQQAFTELLNQLVDVVIGAYDSDHTLWVAKNCEARRLPVVVNLSGDRDITASGFRHVFRVFPQAQWILQNGLRLVEQDARISAVRGPLLLDPLARDRLTQYVHQNFAKLFENSSGSASEMVFLMSSRRHWRDGDFAAMGLQAPVIVNPFGLGELADLDVISERTYLVNTPWFDFKQPLAVEWARQYRQNYGEKLSVAAGFTFEAYAVVATAFQRRQRTSFSWPQALRETHLSQRVMLGGGLRFDHSGQNPLWGTELLDPQEWAKCGLKGVLG